MAGYPEIKYEGWDFVELHRAFNLPFLTEPWSFFCEETDAIVIKSYLRKILSNYALSQKPFVARYTAKHIRLFSAVLAEGFIEMNCPDDALVWEAIASMKDDWVVIGTFHELVQVAWS